MLYRQADVFRPAHVQTCCRSGQRWSHWAGWERRSPFRL